MNIHRCRTIKYGQQEPRASIMENCKPCPFEFIGELDQALSSSLGAKVSDDLDEVHGAFVPLPSWLELTLIFTSTTIATSILSKVGEDFYNLIKDKIGETIIKGEQSKEKRKFHLEFDDFNDFERLYDPNIVKITITIYVGKTVVQGIAIVDSYETLVEVIGTAQDMITDAHKKRTKELQILRLVQQHPRNVDMVPGFGYAYDTNKKKWVYGGSIFSRKPTK